MQEEKFSLLEAKNIVSVKRRFMALIPQLYAMTREPLKERDPRWGILFGTIANVFVDTIKFRVERKVGSIRDRKSNKVGCGRCYWWKKCQTSAGVIPKFGQCTNPKKGGEVISFDPYKYPDKAERDAKLASSPIYTKSNHSCTSAKRKTDLRL